MSDAWIGRQRIDAAQCQFIVVSDGFAFGDEENSVPIGPTWLYAADVAVVPRGGEKAHGSVSGGLGVQVLQIELEDFLSQWHPFAGAHGFAPFVGLQFGTGGLDDRVGQFALGEARTCKAAGKASGEIFALVQAQDARAIGGNAGMEPGDGLDGRLVELVVGCDKGAVTVYG